jgi:hypothetical protein
MNHKTGTFEEFIACTLAIVRGELTIDPREPKIWVERTGDNAKPLPSHPMRGSTSC